MSTADNSTPKLNSDAASAFWLVWNPRSGAPSYKHASFEQAQSEAVRLSEKYTGRHYYVLQCLGYAMTGQPTLTPGQLARAQRVNA
jgi:hypothetical protein